MIVPLIETILVRLEETKITKIENNRRRVEGVKAQHCNLKNKNNRRYMKEQTWGPHLEEGAEFMVRIGNREVFGHTEHPKDGRSDLNLAAFIVEKGYMDGDIVKIDLATTSNPPGRALASLVDDKLNFGLSSRATGSLKKAEDGVDEVQDDFEPETWDAVADPSTPGARMVQERLEEAYRQVLAEGTKCVGRGTCKSSGKCMCKEDTTPKEDKPKTQEGAITVLKSGDAVTWTNPNGITGTGAVAGRGIPYKGAITVEKPGGEDEPDQPLAFGGRNEVIVPIADILTVNGKKVEPRAIRGYGESVDAVAAADLSEARDWARDITALVKKHRSEMGQWATRIEQALRDGEDTDDVVNILVGAFGMRALPRDVQALLDDWEDEYVDESEESEAVKNLVTVDADSPLEERVPERNTLMAFPSELEFIEDDFPMDVAKNNVQWDLNIGVVLIDFKEKEFAQAIQFAVNQKRPYAKTKIQYIPTKRVYRLAIDGGSRWQESVQEGMALTEYRDVPDVLYAVMSPEGLDDPEYTLVGLFQDRSRAHSEARNDMRVRSRWPLMKTKVLKIVGKRIPEYLRLLSIGRGAVMTDLEESKEGKEKVTEELTLGKNDKRVIDAFTDKVAMDSQKLTTDGERLDGNWMGGNRIAWWEDEKIHIGDLGSRAAQTVARVIRKIAPKNWMAEAALSEKKPVKKKGMEQDWSKLAQDSYAEMGSIDAQIRTVADAMHGPMTDKMGMAFQMRPDLHAAYKKHKREGMRAFNKIAAEERGNEPWSAFYGNMHALQVENLKKAKKDMASKIQEGNEVLWMRVGDRGDYEEFGMDLSSAAETLRMHEIDEIDRWVQGGFESGDLRGNNYVSFYWGDEDASMVRDLTRAERSKFEGLLESKDASVDNDGLTEFDMWRGLVVFQLTTNEWRKIAGTRDAAVTAIQNASGVRRANITGIHEDGDWLLLLVNSGDARAVQDALGGFDLQKEGVAIKMSSLLAEGFESDESMAIELQTFIANDGQLYRQQNVPIIKNLMTKWAKGQYDSERSVKLWMYLMDSGAKKYAKEMGSPGQKWNDMFPKNIRILAAKMFRDEFEDEARLGNYSDATFLPRKYAGFVPESVAPATVDTDSPKEQEEKWKMEAATEKLINGFRKRIEELESSLAEATKENTILCELNDAMDDLKRREELEGKQQALLKEFPELEKGLHILDKASTLGELERLAEELRHFLKAKEGEKDKGEKDKKLETEKKPDRVKPSESRVGSGAPGLTETSGSPLSRLADHHRRKNLLQS